MNVSKIKIINLLEKSSSFDNTDKKGIRDAMLSTSSIVNNKINKKRIKNFFLSCLSKIKDRLFNKIYIPLLTLYSFIID